VWIRKGKTYIALISKIINLCNNINYFDYFLISDALHATIFLGSATAGWGGAVYNFNHQSGEKLYAGYLVITLI
jgi:hypothetical protein